MHTSTLAALFSLAAFCSATRVDFYSDRGCSLFLGNLDIPSEQGCTTLPDGNTALSAKVPGEMATDCAIELYSDASCNTLQAILDWGVDNGETCTVMNQNVVAYVSLCGLGDGRKASGNKKKMLLKA